MAHVRDRLIGSSPHPALMRMYHLRHKPVHAVRTARAARRVGIPTLENIDLAKIKTSDTLFILGSGPSINGISRQRWQEIAKNDSVGFNFWPFHEFVPTYYFCESIGLLTDSPATDTRYSTVQKMLNLRASAYLDTVKIITDIKPPNEYQLLDYLPAAWKQNLYAAYIEPVVARTPEEFAVGVRYMQRLGAFKRSDHIKWLFKYCGSLTAMITFGVKLGYKRMVLCGIDMGMQNYYFQDPSIYPPDITNYEPVPPSLIHHTARPRDWMVPMQEVVPVLMDEVLKKKKIELYLENSNSALAHCVPILPATA